MRLGSWVSISNIKTAITPINGARPERKPARFHQAAYLALPLIDLLADFLDVRICDFYRFRSILATFTL